MTKQHFGTSHVPLSPAVRAGDFVRIGDSPGIKASKAARSPYFVHESSVGIIVPPFFRELRL